MSKGIEISFISNAQGVIKGAGSTEDALEKVADALDDMSRDGEKATGRLERSFRDVSQEAREATRDIDRTGDALEQAGRKGRTIDTDVRAGTARAGEAVREWGDEAKQNVAETFSSFRGEAGDFVQIVQDTFGGVISSLGPLGIAAGIAGAAGIGIMQGAFAQSDEEAQELRERIAELAEDFIETGGVGESSLDALVERLKDLATSTEEGRENLAGIREDAADSVTGYRRIADAYAGNTKELDALVKKEREHYEVLKAASEESGISWDKPRQEAAIAKREAQKRIVEGLEEAQTAADGARKSEEAWLASNGPAYQARAEQVEAIQSELDDAIGAWGDYADAEAGALDPAGYITAMQTRMDATANFTQNVRNISSQFGLTAEETQAILDQGIDFAPMLQSIIDSGLSEQYAGQIRAMLTGGQSIVDGTPLQSTVTVQADTDSAGILLDALTKPSVAPVQAEASTKDAAKALDTLATTPRTATIKAVLNTDTADAALSAWLTRRREMTVTVATVDREGKPVL